jgi:streptomycin adenylyltransferase
MWQSNAVEKLSQFFEQEPEAKAFVLTGSLATTEIQTDIWSDVDAKIVLADHALGKYFSSIAWLSPFGKLIGVEKHESRLTKTLRVCLEGFQRFDFVFISESALQQPDLWDDNPFASEYLVVWSKLPNLETQIAALPSPTTYQDISHEELQSIADEFWFKAAIAIAKVMRNDLLIGLHLTLDLERTNLVLQMIKRDRKLRTTIHRIGGWGNEVITRFPWYNENGSGEGILSFIRLNCELFDELAPELIPTYQPRGPLLFPTIELAQQNCYKRTSTE